MLDDDNTYELYKRNNNNYVFDNKNNDFNNNKISDTIFVPDNINMENDFNNKGVNNIGVNNIGVNDVVVVDDKNGGSFLSSLLPQNSATWYMIVASLILTILFLVGSYFGARKKWYKSLPVKSNENTWVIAALWVVASLISYGIFYFIKDKDEAIYGQSRIYPYFVIISFLNVLWVVVFFNNQDFVLALLIIGLIFAIQLYVIIFLFYISMIAAILLIPLELLYAYLFYSILHLASINNITL